MVGNERGFVLKLAMATNHRIGDEQLGVYEEELKRIRVTVGEMKAVYERYMEGGEGYERFPTLAKVCGMVYRERGDGKVERKRESDAEYFERIRAEAVSPEECREEIIAGIMVGARCGREVAERFYGQLRGMSRLSVVAKSMDAVSDYDDSI